MPDGLSGWQYFRLRIEGNFERFFWSPDHFTWLVQDKSGVTLELGSARDGSGVALESDPNNANHVYRWNVVRQYDPHLEAAPPSNVAPRPVNVTAFRYATVDGQAYLTDIYDTPPASDPAGAPLSAYAHHTRLIYEARPDTTFSYRRGWATKQSQRLVRIDVASKTFVGATDSARRLVRRYHLAYDPNFHVSILNSVQLEGRHTGAETGGLPEQEAEAIADTVCTPVTCLPPMTFDYQHVAPFDASGNAAGRDLAGYEGFDERIHSLAGSPDHSVDEELTDLFDINADGLPDVLVTAPSLFNGKHGVWFNGAEARSMRLPRTQSACSAYLAPMPRRSR